MTVTASRESRKVVVNDGSFANPIDFDQLIESTTHLKVYADTTLLSVGTHYSVTGIGDAAGVEITINATGLLLDPDNWVVLHDPLIDQNADLGAGGGFGLPYENAIDALTRRMQALKERMSRFYSVPVDHEGDIPDVDFEQAHEDALAAIEAAAAAEAAALAAINVATPTFASVPAAEAYSPLTAPSFIRTIGFADAGDGGGATYKKVLAAPTHPATFSITLSGGGDPVHYELAEPVIRLEMLGAVPDSVGSAGANAAALDDALATMKALERRLVGRAGSVYYTDDVHTLDSDFFDIGSDGGDWVTIKTSATTGAVLSGYPSNGTTPILTTTMNANKIIGDKTLGLASTTGIAKGDIIRLTSNKAWYNDPREADGFVEADANNALAQAGGASTITLHAGHTTPAATVVGASITIRSGTGAGQARLVTAFDEVTKIATVSQPWGTVPDNTSRYQFPEATKGQTNRVRRVIDASTVEVDSPLDDGYHVADTVGADQAVNGAFTTDTDWTKGTGTTISGGKANASAVVNGATVVSQSQTLSVGTIYKATFEVSGYVAGGVQPRFGGGTGVNGSTVSANGTHVQYLVAATGNNILRFTAIGTTTLSIDNVKLEPVTTSAKEIVTVTVYRPFTPRIERVRFEGPGGAIDLHGASIFAAVAPRIDMSFRGVTESGLRASLCYVGDIEIDAEGVNDVETGYGCQLSHCNHMSIKGKGFENRRLFDISGTTPCANTRVHDTIFIGGGLREDGAAWKPLGANTNSAIGSHGPGRDTIYENNYIASCGYGIYERGYGCTIRNNTFGPRVDWPIHLSHGGPAEIYGNVCDPRCYENYNKDFSANETEDFGAADPSIAYAEGLVILGANFRENSRILVRDNICRVKNGIVLFQHTLGVTRTFPDLSVYDNDAEYYPINTTDEVGVFNKTTDSGASGIRIGDGGRLGPNHQRTAEANLQPALCAGSNVSLTASAGDKHNFGLGRWSIRMADDTVAWVPVGQSEHDRLFVAVSTDGVAGTTYFVGWLGRDSATVVGNGSASMEHLAAAPTPAGGTDGRLQTHFGSGKLSLGNRLGSTQVINVQIGAMG